MTDTDYAYPNVNRFAEAMGSMTFGAEHMLRSAAR